MGATSVFALRGACSLYLVISVYCLLIAWCRLEEYFDHLYSDFVASLTKPRSSAKAASSEGVESSAAEDEGDDNESGANDEEAEEDGYDEEVDGEGHGGMSKDIMEVANGVE